MPVTILDICMQVFVPWSQSRAGMAPHGMLQCLIKLHSADRIAFRRSHQHTIVGSDRIRNVFLIQFFEDIDFDGA
jgi:hypothetical protein